MVDHISRKITILLTLLVVSVAALYFLGFRMGLDLQGGTRLVYSVDIDAAVEEGVISKEQAEDRDGLMDEMIAIWLKRIDPQGVKGVSVRTEGTEQVVIELPGSASAPRRSVKHELGDDMAVDDVALHLATDPSLNVLEQEAALSGFPASGGLIEIEGERIRYSKRMGHVLQGLGRGLEQTNPAPHTTGTMISLKASDPWRQLIENTGDMSFMIEAVNEDFKDPVTEVAVTDLVQERELVNAWIQENPDVSINDYNATLAVLKDTPRNRLRWYPRTTTQFDAKLEDLIEPLILEENLEWRFTGADFPTFFQSQDKLGLPAVGFASTPEKQNPFGEFTKHHKNMRMAIVINDEIVTFPEIHGRLQGEGVIEGGRGGFTADEVNDLVSVLRSGSLRIRPQFEAQETVGATLGSDYVNRGFFSALLGLVIVLVFMMFYYRRLGVLAGISLLFNLVLLMGAMAFMRATLTLPGVAGIILTVGMAVDANILIYERIREETLRGRKPIQAAKDGFRNATSTILDANITTLITALILYKFGTGAVKGFATTLSVGIITSLISVLMLTRIMVHFTIERGVDEWKMMRWVTETKINFIDKAKTFVPISAIMVVLGVALFSMQDPHDKWGIEFTGGTTATVRVEEPATTVQMREMFDPIKNDLIAESTVFTNSVTIAPISSSAQGDGYLAFRITAKSPDTDLNAVRGDITDYLAPILQKGPVDVTVDGTTASGRLYFETSHALADIETALATKCNMVDPKVTAIEGSETIYAFTGRVSEGKANDVVSLDIQSGLTNLKADAGEVLSLSNPISELTSVGAQVVDSLRDKALLAIILSLFAAVMYIRVRFAEYSYGFAAVLALVHDVCITLGALAIMIATGLIRAEIDLAMIAAFLTIIGYSLNDTIVVFDRVRENLPRMKGDLKSIVNRSINQTLSRTLLTSVTTLITVSLLFAFNFGTRNVIEGLAYALIIGVMVGTYSSMFIASPALVWLENRRMKNMEGEEQAPAEQIAEKA